MPVDPHGDADVRLLQRGRVVDAVAGHRDDLAARLQGVDDPQLVRGRHAGVDRAVADRVLQAALVERVEIGAGQRAGAGPRDPQVVGDADGRGGMVACDQHRADARSGRLCDRSPRLWSRRVDDPGEPEVHELVLDRLVLGRQLFVGRQRPVGDGQRAQRETCQAVDRPEHLRTARVRQRTQLARRALQRAALEQDIGSPLGEHGDPALLLVCLERRHQLALGAERHLAHSLEALLAGLGEAGDLRLRDEEGSLGGIALDHPLAVVLPKHGVVRQAPSADHVPDLVEQHGIVERTAADAQLALRPVSAAGDVDLARGGDDILDRHLVLRQRPGLVRADHRGRPERLHRRELLHDRPPTGHALHAEGKDDRENGRQALGHRGDRQRHADEQDVDDVGRVLDVCGQQNRRHDHDRDDDHGHAERASGPIHLALQRRALLLRAAEQARDVPHLGRHAGGRHDRAATPTGDGRPVEHHVHPVAEGGRRGERGDVLQHRLALARERGLRHRERRSLHQAGVRAHRVALGQEQDVTRDDIGGRDAHLAPVAHDPGRRRGHLLQRGDCPLRTGLLHVAEHGVEDDDHCDHDRLVRHAVRPFRDPGDERHGHRREEEVDQWIGELGEKLAPRRHGLGRVEEVTARSAPDAPPPPPRSSPTRRSVPRSAATSAASRCQGSSATGASISPAAAAALSSASSTAPCSQSRASRPECHDEFRSGSWSVGHSC